MSKYGIVIIIALMVAFGYYVTPRKNVTSTTVKSSPPLAEIMGVDWESCYKTQSDILATSVSITRAIAGALANPTLLTEVELTSRLREYGQTLETARLKMLAAFLYHNKELTSFQGADTALQNLSVALMSFDVTERTYPQIETILEAIEELNYKLIVEFPVLEAY